MARKTATMDARPATAEPVDHLPPGPEPFTGRRAELAALTAQTHRPAGAGCRVLVIAGRPGSGRSALALRFARSLADRRQVLHARLRAPDGTPLEAGAAARELLDQLDRLDRPGEESARAGLLPADGQEDPACAELRAALTGRDTLLLLDGVADAQRLGPLLPEEPRCLVLAVTEGPLTGLADGYAVDPVILRGLEEPAAVELLTSLVGGTRVSCDPVGAVELAGACAGRPAPLRLMAGWLRARPKAAVPDAVAALAGALAATTGAGDRVAGADAADGTVGGSGGSDSLVRGEGGPDGGKGGSGGDPGGVPGWKAGSGTGSGSGAGLGGAPGRKAGPGGAQGGVPGRKNGSRAGKSSVEAGGDPLTAALMLRHQALPIAQARLLRMLTLAPAQLADLRTASALVGCPAPEAAAALHALAGQELLEQEAPAPDGTPRYRVPGRLYDRLAALREELDRPAAVQLARARLLERLIRLVDSARALLDPSRTGAPDPLPGPLRLRGAAHARQWLLGERASLLGAAEDAIGQGDLDGSAGRLVSALLRTLPLTGAAAPADLYRLHTLVLRMAERHGSAPRAAAALLNLGDLQAAAGHWQSAAARYQAALERAREPLDERASARALEGAGECCRALGDPVRAADWYGRALALRQSLDDPAAQARLLARTAEAHAAQRRLEEAGREYRAALALLRRLGDERGVRAVTAALDDLLF